MALTLCIIGNPSEAGYPSSFIIRSIMEHSEETSAAYSKH